MKNSEHSKKWRVLEWTGMIVLLLACIWVFTWQEEEIRALHTQIDSVKAQNVRLFEKTFYPDTIYTYVFRGIIEEKKQQEQVEFWMFTQEELNEGDE